MSLENYIHLENQVGEEKKANPLNRTAFLAYLEKEKEMKDAAKRPVAYFFEDLTNIVPLGYDFKLELTPQSFIEAKSNAKACLNLNLRACKVPPQNFTGWVQHALQFFDPLILHFYQKVRQNTIREPEKTQGKSFGEDRWAYRHIIDNGVTDEEKQMGWKFDGTYELLNEGKHLKKTNSQTGKVEIKSINRRKKLGKAIAFLSECGRLLLEQYKAEAPQEQWPK